MIEFYGEVSEYTKRRTDLLRRRCYATWLAVLAGVLAVCTAIAAFAGGFWVLLACTLILGCTAAVLYFLPMKKSMEQVHWVFRVTIDGDTVTWIQYLPDREIKKVKPLRRIKKVYKTKYCYYLVYGDLGNAIVCERSLLRRGTFDRLESLFSGKLFLKDVRV